MTTPQHHPRLPALCPYCGHGHTLSPDKPRPLQCESCKGRFEPLSRQATQNAMGPWQIRDPQQPFRPPCSYETIARLAQRGKVTQMTIVRGPTTRQFWAYARDTPGIAAILGLCHSCHTTVSPDDRSCPSCEAVLRPTTDRQQLGLSPIAALPGEAPPEQIAALIRPRTPQPMPGASSDPAPALETEASPETAAIPPTPIEPTPILSRNHRSSMWPKLLIGAQFVAILALVAILLWQTRQSHSPSAGEQRTAQNEPQVPEPSPSSPVQSTDQPDDPVQSPSPAPVPAADLDTLMDDAMHPFESRYWQLVEGTRSDDIPTLDHAVDRLRALRAEAAAADPDAQFPLTNDLIAMADQRLDELRLLEQFSRSP